MLDEGRIAICNNDDCDAREKNLQPKFFFRVKTDEAGCEIFAVTDGPNCVYCGSKALVVDENRGKNLERKLND